jgi:heme a synthase
MKVTLSQRSSRPVAIWLLVGVGMIIIQVLLGGITRLTGSGLSITEWKPIMGALPPMNDQDWNAAFEKYKQIAQYKYLNSDFKLSDFKFIFFWEWFHRLWARLLGVVFIIPFIIFLIQKRIKKEMVQPLIILFLIGALLGIVGWLMVMTGLDNERLYVSHYMLALHFTLAQFALCYALWFALDLLIKKQQIVINAPLRKFAAWLVLLLVVQLIYGAFMAGLKAATFAPTWPDINGNFFPHGGSPTSGLLQFFDNPITVHFIHRNLAYLISILVFVWCGKAYKVRGTKLFQKTKWLPLFIVLLQVLLGILTVLNAINPHSFLWLAVAHQFVAMVLLLSLVQILYMVRSRTFSVSA